VLNKLTLHTVFNRHLFHSCWRPYCVA